MKKHRSENFITVILIILVLTTIIVYAAPPEEEENASNGKLLKEVGITDEQREQLRELWYESAKKHIRLRADLRVARMELEHAMKSEKIEKGKIEKKIDEIANIQKELLRANIEKRINTKDMLTAEQFKALQKVARKRLVERARDERMIRFRQNNGRRPLAPPREEFAPRHRDQLGARSGAGMLEKSRQGFGPGNANGNETAGFGFRQSTLPHHFESESDEAAILDEILQLDDGRGIIEYSANEVSVGEWE